MSPCPHKMPNPKTCVDCMEEGNIEPAKWKRVGTPFNANLNFTSTCPACKEDIVRGESIQRWDKEDSETKYTHAWGCEL